MTPATPRLQSSFAPRVSASISERISDCLQLNDDPKRDEIISALLKNGRQALFQYEDDLIPKVFSVEQNYVQGQPDTPLLKLLQEHVRKTFETTLTESCSELRPLIQREKERNAVQFMAVERRLAEHFTPYTNASFVLFFVLQYLFDGVDYINEDATDIFKRLLEDVTREGIEGTKKFEQYIAKDDLDNQLNNNQSLLYSTLRIYFEGEVRKMLVQYKISCTPDACQFLVENIAREGWIAALEAQSFKTKISPNQYTKLREIIQQEQQSVRVKLSDRLPLGKWYNKPSLFHNDNIYLKHQRRFLEVRTWDFLLV